LRRIWGQSNVNLARNRLTARAFQEGTARDLWLWIDDDHFGPVTGDAGVEGFVGRALEAFGPELLGVLVGGVYAPKARNASTAIVQVPDWSQIEGPLRLGRRGDYYPAIVLGGGALLLSLTTFIRIVARTGPPQARYARNPGPPDGWQVWTNGVRMVAGTPREGGEDEGFCCLAREAGCRTLIDSRWIIGHDGGHMYWPGDAWLGEPELPQIEHPDPRRAPRPGHG